MHNPYKAGDTMQNGATVLETNGERVAAHFPQSMHPFVTWTVNAEGVAFWGHYFETASQALADLVEA